ncbi:MAG: sulfite exporter TauE/SafE family protein [Marinilabiliales bacterium]|nr:MAG: sulfite exporter TauE/SafE family protein [Marinilabiliales bacterium]
MPAELSGSLTVMHWAVLAMVALFVGMSKTGIYGLGMLAAPLLAGIFGGKISAGLLLPMLSMADIIAVIYYNRHASWHHLRKLFPFAALGIIAAIWVGAVINDSTFKILMGIFILGGIPVMIWRERMRNTRALPANWWTGSFFGVTGGFSTMIGNTAGPIMSLYLLAMQLPKNVLIGTGAWFFLVVNLFKIPFHILVWETITLRSFTINLVMLPVIITGGFLGIRLVRIIPEKPFRWLIIIMTTMASVRLFF